MEARRSSCTRRLTTPRNTRRMKSGKPTVLLFLYLSTWTWGTRAKRKPASPALTSSYTRTRPSSSARRSAPRTLAAKRSNTVFRMADQKETINHLTVSRKLLPILLIATAAPSTWTSTSRCDNWTRLTKSSTIKEQEVEQASFRLENQVFQTRWSVDSLRADQSGEFNNNEADYFSRFLLVFSRDSARVDSSRANFFHFFKFFQALVRQYNTSCVAREGHLPLEPRFSGEVLFSARN